MDLGNKTALCFDRGLYSFLAQKLGESFGRVLYYMDCPSPYPESQRAQIGKGLPELEWIDDPWPHVDKADLLCFFDCNDGRMQHYFREKGYRVFGSGRSERLELDKAWFLEQVSAARLPVPHTYRAEGLEDLERYLADAKGEKWLKTSYYRGDFETQKFRGMKHLRPWLSDLRQRIGERRAKEIEILVQSPIDAKCEAGYDGFCVDGEFTDNCLVGYEIKDKGLVAKVFEQPPEILARVNDAMGPLFRKLGYRGHYSTEIRITAEGKPYFIDPTCRAPSPPSELMCELYANYAEAVWQIAGGEVPTLKPKAPYGAEIVLSSAWHESHELCVEFPRELAPFVKLKNQTRRQGTHYIVPNGNGGIFGAVVAYGKTMDEATRKALEYAEQIECAELDYESSLFDQAAEQTKCGEAFGIPF